MTLDQLLTEREEIAKSIEHHVEKDTKGWGLEVTGLRIQDIDMPEELKKMMSRQASAEREKRATITKAEGDKEAAVNLSLAARTMAESPGAMQLRTLQTIDGLGPTASNTVVLAIPIDVLESLGSLKDAFRGQWSVDGSIWPPGVIPRPAIADHPDLPAQVPGNRSARAPLLQCGTSRTVRKSSPRP